MEWARRRPRETAAADMLRLLASLVLASEVHAASTKRPNVVIFFGPAWAHTHTHTRAHAQHTDAAVDVNH